MKKQKIKNNNKSNPSLLLSIVSIVLACIILAILIVVLIYAINKNIFGHNGYLWVIVSGLVIILIISIFISIFVNTKINKYTKIIRNALNKIANGDFNVTFRPSKNAYINDIIQDFNTMVTKLNSVSMLRNDFVSNFSHEFKTPLASIKGFAELLRDKTDIDDKDKIEYLNIIIEECTRMTDLASNTLLISKLDTEEGVNNKTKIYLDEQIDQCLFLLDSTIKNKGIVITTKLKKAPCLCDNKLMNQVWINLIGNAIKFCKEHVNITITKDKNTKENVIKISNDGARVEQDKLNSIFDKFYQTDKSRNSDGNGLGLAICKRIIALHGGSICATCKDNEPFTIIVKIK